MSEHKIQEDKNGVQHKVIDGRKRKRGCERRWDFDKPRKEVNHGRRER